MAALRHCPDLLLSALPDLILGLTEAVKSTAGKYLSSKGFQQGLGDVPWDSPVVKRCLESSVKPHHPQQRGCQVLGTDNDAINLGISRASCENSQHHTLDWSIHSCWVQNSLVVNHRLKVGGETTFPVTAVFMLGGEDEEHKKLGYMYT